MSCYQTLHCKRNFLPWLESLDCLQPDTSANFSTSFHSLLQTLILPGCSLFHTSDKHNSNTLFSNKLTSQSCEAPGNQPSTHATSCSTYWQTDPLHTQTQGHNPPPHTPTSHPANGLESHIFCLLGKWEPAARYLQSQEKPLLVQGIINR